ncbi:MAG: ISAzo13 family transposase [Candidatus Omnitrophica bacterium]|nr:ISAzo13 family transposase [Candidatus Omnitrophota bacterium]
MRDDATLVKLLDTLDEGQKRWLVGREAMLLGHGGIKHMCEVSGLSKPTVLKGVKELRSKQALRTAEGRIRQVGGGRKTLEERDPQLTQLLRQIMDETTAGDPMSLLRWTSKSTYQIRDELRRRGHSVSEDTVQRRLKEMDYTLQANLKTKEGNAPPERDEQFRYINRLAQEYVAGSQPVISVDAKKRERVGAFKNAGRQWRPKGQPLEVNVYDFPHLGMGTATLYGAFDEQMNQGMVNVGVSHDTSEYAVESIRQWWRRVGRRQYPRARRLLICADGGGSNGSRNRAWKYFLQQLSNESGLEITVCHYPPGTSKWNKIEHRMFSFISLNWQGQPLVSYETVIQLISATTTRTGLKIRARLDKRTYATGIEIADQEMEKLNLRLHEKNPQWNYSLSPSKSKSPKK